MANPIKAAANLADNASPPFGGPHHMDLGGVGKPSAVKPGEKHFHKHKGRSPVEMKASHGMRNSSRMVDKHASSDKHPELPGMHEKGARVIQKAAPGPQRFGDQGRGGIVARTSGRSGGM